MPECVVPNGEDRINVGMGQATIASEPACAIAILGSCVGVSLYSPQHKVGAFGHVVLPHTNSPTAMPVKYADTAVPQLLRMLRDHGIRTTNLVAKVAGGAYMFAGSSLPRIGDDNIAVVLQSLQAAGIRVAAHDVGGTKGRKVVFDSASGSLTIHTVDGSPKVL